MTDNLKPTKEAELELKKAQLVELEYQDRLEAIEDRRLARADRLMKEQEKQSKFVLRSQQLDQDDANQRAKERGCNHHKGGMDGGPGDSDKYSVIKHQMQNGDWWVRCTRCGKTWTPPTKEEFTINGKFNLDAFTARATEHAQALAFQTTNKASGSYLYGGDGFQEKYRESVKNTNLL